MTGVVASNDNDDETDSLDGTLIDKDSSDDRESELQDSRTTLDDYDGESSGG